jgi:SAM-dependent methyltransferase
MLAALAPAASAWAGRRPAILDVGCGKGEILIRAMQRFGATGVGVEPNPSFHSEARVRAAAAGVTDDLVLHLATIAAAPVPRGAFEVVICTGATHAFGAYRPALDAIAQRACPAGAALVGIGYWKQPPDPAYLASFGGREDEMLPLAETLAVPARAGWRMLAHHASTPAEWDEYELGYEAALRRWFALRPGDPDLAGFRERIDAWADGYARWGRATMGFVTMAMRR